MKKKAIFVCLLVSLLFSVSALAQEFYYFDTSAVFPWGWQIRKSTYDNGTVQWVLDFSLRSASSPVTWNDIEDVKIWKRNEDGSFSEVSFSRSNERDDYINVISARFDFQVSWLRTTCPAYMDPFSCYFSLHESNAVISGLEPQLNETYKLQIKLVGNDIWIESLQWKMPVTMNLKPVPLRSPKTITNKKGKTVETGDIVPAITIKEINDGSLVVQYIEPFIEEAPPPIVWVYDNQMNLADNAWQGTHIRLGIRLTLDSTDPDNPMYLVWPDIPSNVGTVVFPRELVNVIKTKEQFTGTVYFSTQHRDRLNTARWQTGYIPSFPYTFVNPEVID